MADDKIWDRLYETVYGSITRWPVRSLGFFILWLAFGWWLRTSLGSIGWPEALHVSLFTACLIVPGVGIVLCLHRILVVHDLRSSFVDVSSLEAVKKSFVGRDDDAQELTTLILNSRQVWLNGDSGVGKSLLLQKAVLPALRSKGIEVVYLNSWRGDWEQGPALAVLDKFGQHPSENILEALQISLDSFSGVIILDQFDEFQIVHADKFISSSAIVISRANLESHNRFFRILNDAMRQRRIRCVFVTRRDVEWAKRPVLLDEAEEFFLGRLSRRVVDAEISRIIPLEAVREPENGWCDLRSQLCDDLASDGVLPIQMRFAILGLENLRKTLTTSAYFRAGGLNGLVSDYLESEIRRISGSQVMSREIFTLLDCLVSAEGTSTIPVAEAQLLQHAQFEHVPRLSEVRENLQQSDIVRRVLSANRGALWRLDHDYLAAPVRSMVRRQLPEQWELQEDYHRFLGAPWWRKVQRLGFPTKILSYFRATLFRGLRLGPATSWILFSISAHLLLASCITYLVWSRVDGAASEQQGRDLFDRFDGAAIKDLAHANLAARQAFLKIGLESATNTSRLKPDFHEIVVALSHLNAQDADALFHHSASPLIDGWPAAPRDRDRWDAICTLVNDWGLASFVTQAEADTLSARLVDLLIAFNDPDEHTVLQQALADLAGKISPAEARNLAAKLSAQISARPRYTYALPGMARALNSVRRNLTTTSIDPSARIIVDEMRAGRDYLSLTSLAEALEALGSDVSMQVANGLADDLLGRMNGDVPGYDTFLAGVDSDGRFAAFARAVAAIKDRVTADKVEAAAASVTLRMGRTPDPKSLHLFASRLGALGNSVKVEQVGVAATTLVDRMRTVDDADELRELAGGLGDLGSNVSEDTIRAAAMRLVARMNRDLDLDVFRMMAVGLSELGARADPDTIDAAATKIVDQWAYETSGEAIDNLATGLESLGSKVSSRRAGELAEKLVSIMVADEGNSDKAARGFAGLGPNGNSDRANALLMKLLPHVAGEIPSSYEASTAYRSYASAIASLRNATLNSAQFATIRAVFEMDRAPCALVVELEPTARKTALEQQLFNPVCGEKDWNQIALALSQMTPQSFATGDPSLPSDINVDFIGLSKYMAGQHTWYRRIRSTPPQSAGIVLLMASAAILIWGLIVSSADKSGAFTVAPESIHPR